jgi:hypothetical protein
VDEHLRGRRNRSGLLWRMLILELWHRNFLEAGHAAAASSGSGAWANQNTAESTARQ